MLRRSPRCPARDTSRNRIGFGAGP
jgi:hypothetical protein